MTEAVVSGKDTRCLFINNGDDLLTLKKVVSKKSDKDDGEKQKNNKSKETNGSELNGNHNKTDSINFDVDNTSSLEPNLEMDSDTDRNITIDSICTQDDRESENIDISNENSNEADVKNDEKDTQAISVKCLDIPYSPSDSLNDTEYSHNLEDDEDLESNNVQSPVSIFNISSRPPLHSNDDFDTLDEDILPIQEFEINLRKRKIEDSLEHNSGKVLKLWNIMKYPFQKVTIGSSINKNEANISKAEIVTENEKCILPKTAVYINTSNGIETKTDIEDTSENSIIKKYCSIM